MKFIKLIAASLMALAACATVRAQNFDTFSQPRAIVLAPPTVLTAAAATVTNGPIDIGGYLGTANIDIFSCTNAGGALTASLYTSSDETNLVAVSNYALISGSTSYSYTNRIYGGTNVYATNPLLLPGTITAVPTPSGVGFAGSYLDTTTVPFTNSAAITITAKGVYRVGLRAADQRRYLYIVWTPTGSNSNDIVGATFNGIRGSEFTVGQ